MKKILLGLLIVGAITAMMWAALRRNSQEISPLSALAAQYRQKPKPSVDHSLFIQLKTKFEKPQDVTAACISCHNGRHLEVMQSTHWNWERTEYIPGKGIRSIGKKNVLNNFCIGVSGNEQSCERCHIGYGLSETTAQDPRSVDCLACHDRSGTYEKASGGAGMPAKSVDLSNVAQHVGLPNRLNCGTCHFDGGGGNNVKHGDLEEALLEAPRKVDVHMGVDGADMQCIDCHTARQHQMLGKMYSVSSMNRNRVECEHCHSQVPHSDDVLNSHTLKVACQTCHIPTYAKVNPTKMSWDWSTAGRLKNGKAYEETDESGTDVYMSIKGSFQWSRNVKPDYIWFDGSASHYLLGDKLDPSRPLKMNELYGGYSDPDARIYPVKIHRAKQIYDTENMYLIQPKLVSTQPGDGAYWNEFDWNRAAEQGMKQVGLPYSGKYGFVETEMYWPVNHMIAPKEEAVKCGECHTRNQGRLAGLGGFYLPGRDSRPWVEIFGTALLALMIAGAAVHGGARFAVNLRSKREKEND
jgi:octaheme c-type cytochrome (tetrathionate reductase family)